MAEPNTENVVMFLKTVSSNSGVGVDPSYFDYHSSTKSPPVDTPNLSGYV